MTTRRYLVCIATQSSDSGMVVFDNKVVNIEGDLEKGIEKFRDELQKALEEARIDTFRPTIVSLAPLDNIRPPSYVELPTTVRQSMEQLVIDYDKGNPAGVVDIRILKSWLKAIRGE